MAEVYFCGGIRWCKSVTLFVQPCHAHSLLTVLFYQAEAWRDFLDNGSDVDVEDVRPAEDLVALMAPPPPIFVQSRRILNDRLNGGDGHGRGEDDIH